jgi:hypothetical protein
MEEENFDDEIEKLGQKEGSLVILSAVLPVNQ